jgi:SAM-dependent methyltransferase
LSKNNKIPANQTAFVDERQYDANISRQTRIARRIFHSDWWVSRILHVGTQEAAAEFAGGHLVDIGCGGKPYQALFAPFIKGYLGLDIYSKTSNTPDVFALAQALPLQNASADTVFLAQVLEHVSEPWTCLREVSRILKPGGHLILTVPQTWMLHEAPFDFYRYTPHGLKYLCERAGLEVVLEKPLGNGWATLALAIFHQCAWTLAKVCRFGKTWHSARQDSYQKKINFGATLIFILSAIPFSVLNCLLYLLDCLPDIGIFNANNIIVARKPT